MFVGAQVDIEGEEWMVSGVDKCYYCIYERDNLLDVIINYLFWNSTSKQLLKITLKWNCYLQVFSA